MVAEGFHLSWHVDNNPVADGVMSLMKRCRTWFTDLELIQIKFKRQAMNSCIHPLHELQELEMVYLCMVMHEAAVFLSSAENV